MTTPRHDAEPIAAPGETAPQPAATPRLDDLAVQIAFHREQEAFHAQRVAFHEVERAHHQQAAQRLTRGEASPPQPALYSSRPWFEPPAPGRRLPITYWVARLTEEFSADQSFTASSLTETLNSLCAPHLPKPIESPQVGLVLSRFAKRGHLRLLQPGTSHREAVYGRQVR